MTPDGVPVAVRIAILADDLIWSTRLADAVRRSGGAPAVVRTADALVARLPEVDGCVVDLTARAYDAIAAIAAARDARVAVIAVGQHDDARQRRAARAAGAVRVLAYRTVHEHGDRELGPWITGLAGPAGRVDGGGA